MEKNEQTNQTLSASLCTSGCGFFGNPQFDGMCSQCCKDALKRKQANDGSCSVRPTTPSRSSSISSQSRTVFEMSSSKPAASAQSTTSSADTADSTSTLSAADSTKTAISRKTSPSEETATATTGAAAVDKPEAASESPVASPAPSEPEKKTKKRNRCSTCKKKVGLTGFECRCGGLYCSLHRYSDTHDCQFDYKKDGEEMIRKNNPLIVAAKVQKI